jgi:peptidoglycan/LPS O-acetylase OafA/YrhL
MSAVTIARKAEEAAVLPGRIRPVPERRATRARWGEIELYRVGAALAVVAYHIRQSMQVHVYAPERQGLHVGSDYPYQSVAWFEFVMTNIDVVVDFFFVISGFLLALPWVRSVVNQTPAPSVRAWAIGRMARVIPLYWFLVVIVWATRNYSFPAEWRDLVEHLTFTQWLDSKRIFWTLGPAWSLAVEVGLYFLIPLLLVVVAKPIRRLSARGARLFVLSLPVMAVGAASVGFKYWVAHNDAIDHTNWSWDFGVPAKADLFCVGILVAILFIALKEARMPAWCGVVVRLLSFLAIYYISAMRVERQGDWLTYYHSLAALPMAGLTIAVVLSKPGRLSPLLNSKPIVLGGSLTFALYLGHEPLFYPLEGLGWLSHREDMLLVNWAVTIPLAIAFAYVLHKVIETPAMRLRNLFDERGRHKEFYPDLVEEERPTAALPTQRRRGSRRTAEDRELVGSGQRAS